MYIDVAEVCVCVPANGLADRHQEILGLVRDWGEGLQDNMAVLRANPDRSSRVVSLQMEPRKIVLLEDVRDELVLLLPMSNYGARVSVLFALGKLAS